MEANRDRALAAAVTHADGRARVLFAGEEATEAHRRGASGSFAYKSLLPRSMFENLIQGDLANTPTKEVAASLQQIRLRDAERDLQRHDLDVAPLVERLLQDDAERAAIARRARGVRYLNARMPSPDRIEAEGRAPSPVPAADEEAPIAVFDGQERQALETRATAVFHPITAAVDLRAWRYTRMAAALAQRLDAMQVYGSAVDPTFVTDDFDVYRKAHLSRFYRRMANDLLTRLHAALAAPGEDVRTLRQDLAPEPDLKAHLFQTLYHHWGRSVNRALANLAGETGATADEVEHDADNVNLMLEEALAGTVTSTATAIDGGTSVEIAAAPNIVGGDRNDDYWQQAHFLQTIATSGESDLPFANFPNVTTGWGKFKQSTTVSDAGVIYTPQRWAGAREHAMVHVLRHETFFDARKMVGAIPHSTFRVDHIGQSLQWVDEAITRIRAVAGQAPGAMFDSNTYRDASVSLTKNNGDGDGGQNVRSVFVVDMGREIGTRGQQHLTLVFIGESMRLLTAYPV